MSYSDKMRAINQLNNPSVRCHFHQNGDNGIFTVTPIINGRELVGICCGGNRELADWLIDSGRFEQALKDAYRKGHEQTVFDMQNHIKGLLGL